MKKLLFALAALVLATNVSADSTFVDGSVVNETWSPAGSPYCVTGDINVAGLTIQPGTDVIFFGSYVFEVAGVLTAIGTDQDRIVFTRADGVSGWKGILFQNSPPGSEMSRCVVEYATISGIRIFDSLPNVNNCFIRYNQSGDSGGGVKVSITGISGDLDFSHCSITDNATPTNYTVPISNGGGIWVRSNGGGTVRFVNCTIENNQATRGDGHVLGGGGWITGNVEFIRSSIKNNLVRGTDSIPGGSSAGRGGGLYIEDGLITFSNTEVNDNSATGTAQGGMSGNAGYASGGGVHINNGLITFTNSVVGGNYASSTHGTVGGGIYTNDGETVFENSTLAWNNIHAIQNNAATVSAINSIIYFNNSNSAQISGSVSVTYSDVQGGYAGEGNINYNPVFDGQGCLQILPGSPCIDAGSEDAAYNDVCFPPSWGTERNDLGAGGGPEACGWGTEYCYEVATKLQSASIVETGNGIRLSFELADREEGETIRLHRSLVPEGRWEAIVKNFQPISPNRYEYLDAEVEPAQTYFYKLDSRIRDGEARELYRGSVVVPASEMSLSQNQPNPFNPATAISFILPEQMQVTMAVYDVDGKLIKTLVDKPLSSGSNKVTWDGTNNFGNPVSSGVYFYRLQAGKRVLTKKMVLLK